MVQTALFVCVLLCPLPENSAAYSRPQAKPSRETRERFRFKVTDSENDLPIPEAAVCLVYWRKTEVAEEKKEIELKTDKNGIAEFRRVHANRLAVSVTVKGYRPCWRWIGPTGTEELTRIRLEKWANKLR